MHSLFICSLRPYLVTILFPKDMHNPLWAKEKKKEKRKNSGNFQNKPGWKKKRSTVSVERVLQTNPVEVTRSSFTESTGCGKLAINNTFPRASALTPLHLHFLPDILPGWNWGRPKCWLQITQSSQPLSWAVYQCIKLGLTSPFPLAASHQKFTF